MKCSACFKETMTAKDGFCKGCRLIASTRSRQKYFWTPELDARLRKAYQAKNKSSLAVELAELRRRTGWPRLAFANRAQVLGLRIYSTQPWQAAEVEIIQELAGEVPLAEIARRLKRSPYSVLNKMHTLGIESRLRDGFSRHELMDLMGVRHELVERWIAKRWLEVNDYDRIPHASVERFLWDHMEDYRFAACQEWWLKKMLNPNCGHSASSKPKQAQRQEAA